MLFTRLARPLFVAILAAGLVRPPAAAAADLGIDAFVGTYSGSGIAEAEDPVYSPETVRDMDVTVRRHGDGFSVTWTTVVRRSAGTAKRKTESLIFAPHGPAGSFIAPERRDAFAEGGLAWAGISGETLDIYILMIGDRGSYQLQRYARTLTAKGMELMFTRTAGGENRRFVRGLLVKTAE